MSGTSAKGLAQPAQLGILGPEIVAPLRHAVRLVDGDQRQRDLPQPVDESRVHQAFRRDIQQVEFAGVKSREDLTSFVRAERRVVKGRGDAVCPECVNLVLHQRNQRRYDQCDAVTEQRRQLVTQRLAAAGGHQHEGVVARHQPLDDFALQRPELVQAEHLAQRIGQRVCGGGGWHRGQGQAGGSENDTCSAPPRQDGFLHRRAGLQLATRRRSASAATTDAGALPLRRALQWAMITATGSRYSPPVPGCKTSPDPPCSVRCRDESVPADRGWQ